ncbi:cytochrome c oxidase subunit 2 [Rhizobium sp. BK529]|uniref:cytochrome c oxidase subunit II n=1 Tax=unclassified Rhizobium TaxID=2613769 RepID=UPI00104A7F83|nr:MULTISPECIES: cytochrome c oxidase subunit II [unclassified Rhizobium]MBB3593098.1 cytochrome c oxidase subunit 2 [Rhizobium sp. BK529]TCS07477.1 cytochrome c oxidase subunit 2 [Rhizobium sp. BK418]
MKSRSLPALLLLLSGCGGPQSVLDAYGQAAIALKDLIVFIVLVAILIWLAVMIFMALALLRRQRQLVPDSRSERRITTVVATATAATALVVAVLTVASFYTTRALNSDGTADLTITVRAQQWWWQFIYADQDQKQLFQTANELHIPVGRTVRLRLQAADVIHSFWVPSLAGKLDLIPGRENILTLRAEKPGVYRGQCAEFCGLQHSHMAFVVIVEDGADYQHWLATQRLDGASPTGAETVAGRAVFLAKPCAACHTIRGTPATGSTGPDLTHVGSRRTIAAGLLDTTRGSLAAWIADPQTLKPGNNMPVVPLTADELRQLSAYMESLR